MHARPIVRIMILILAVSVVTLSCSFDYWLDFAISSTQVIDDQLDVGYSMINNGTRNLKNVSIHILVTVQLDAGGSEQQDPWVPIAGVNLTVGEKHSDTITFTFSGPFTDHVEEIIGARWDDDTIY
jgi:hypothetical protein